MSIASHSQKSKKNSSTADPAVTGRFAPSPTGPLHLGSLLAATASYLDAHARGGSWQVRIDDLDTPRNETGAEAGILRNLEGHGLYWDGPIVRQSERLAVYEASLEQLIARGRTFYCRCSRRDLAETPVYPGTCRGRTSARPDSAIRVRVAASPVSFTDLIVGRQNESLAVTLGDFIIRRRDGIYAYQLATAVDDGAREITHVVRGSDLLGNTARQIYLMQLLGLSVPEYAHVPTLVGADGQKLSKRSHTPAVQTGAASANLCAVLGYLGLETPAAAKRWSAREVVAWGVANWRISGVSRATTIHAA